VKTQTALTAVAFVLCALATVAAPNAYAGPSNRLASTQPAPNYPINLDGFGAPLPAVANTVSDLTIFATGQLNFKEIDQVPNSARCSTAPPALDAIRSRRPAVADFLSTRFACAITPIPGRSTSLPSITCCATVHSRRAPHPSSLPEYRPSHSDAKSPSLDANCQRASRRRPRAPLSTPACRLAIQLAPISKAAATA